MDILDKISAIESLLTKLKAELENTPRNTAYGNHPTMLAAYRVWSNGDRRYIRAKDVAKECGMKGHAGSTSIGIELVKLVGDVLLVDGLSFVLSRFSKDGMAAYRFVRLD